MIIFNSLKQAIFSPLGQMARLTEEVGELEVNHYYGEKQKKQTKNQRQYQIGDVFL